MQTIDIQPNGGGLRNCNLLNHKWKEFSFTDIFTDIQRGKRLKKADHEIGNIPYVSSTAQNNGIDGFIGNTCSVRLFEDCLSIANSGSVGSTFFHHYRFIASDHVTKLEREGLDKYAYLFMIPIINRLSEKYSFNREINDERIKREKVILPAKESGEPDFDFMSSFMREVESDVLKTTLRYFIEKQSITPPVKSSNELKYKEFDIQSIFNILPGKRLTKSNMVQGKRPFIGATDSFLNNGITEWVDNYNESLDKNCLGVNYNGSVGETFYHPYSCIFSDDVKRLHLKSSSASHYTMLFLKTAILQQKEKYAYGYKFNEKRMLKQIITLPATPDGSPDWDYMESYMRHHEAQHILSAIQHFQSRS